MASETGYVPLPTMVQARAVASLRQLRDVNDAPLNFMNRDSMNGAVQITRYLDADFNLPSLGS